MREFINLVESLTLKEEVEIKAVRRVQDTGGLTNFNIKQDDPFKLFTGLRNGGSNYSRDDVVKVHYMNDERLQAFLSNSDGRGAVEVDSDGNPVNAPQTDDELDADSADNATPPSNSDWQNPDEAEPESSSTPSAGKIENGRITFSTGETFYREESGKGLRLFQRHVGGLIRRMDELARKMNESVPNSLKAVLSESDKTQLFLEALSNDEAAELVRIVGDLELAIQAEDDQGKFISSTNIGLIRDRIREYRPTVDRAREQMRSSSADDADSADSGTADPEADTPPEAAAASDDSGDQDATVEPGEGETAGSLEAFANSGKGGLANDPDEVDAIKELQQYLNDLGFDTGTVDGQYGRNTINGVKAFQEWMGAAVDGDAGPETIGVIVKLRSIRWGEGGSKDFAEWRRTMTRMEELIGKAGNATESINMNSMSSILETLRRLDEALSDAEAEELQGIVDELQSAYEDAEFQQILPQRVQQRFSNNMRSAQGVLGDRAPADDTADMDSGSSEEPAAGSDDGGSTSTNEPRTDAEIAADPDRDGNADDPEAQTFIADTPSQARQLALAMNGPGTDEDKIFDVLQSLRSVQSWENLKREYQADQNENLMDRFKDELNSSDFVRYVQDPLEDLGVEFDEDGNEVSSQGPEDDVQAGVDGGGVAPPEAGDNVPPRPRGVAANAWDRRYGETHNPDGTPKEGGATATPTQGAEEPGDVAAQAGEPTTADDEEERAVSRDIATGADAEAGASSDTPTRKPPEERLNDMLSVDMNSMDLPQLQQFVRDFKEDEEIWNMLSPQLKSQLEAIL